jgi:hypothetical protein
MDPTQQPTEAVDTDTPVPNTEPKPESHVVDIPDNVEEISQTLENLKNENSALKGELHRLTELLNSGSVEAITEQLWLWIKDCKMRRTAYWKQYYRYQQYNNILSAPLTLIASATGITSIAQLGYEGSTIQIAVAVLGTLSTALNAYQRFFNWGQKAVQCRDIAKRYTLLARRGELQANLFETKRIPVTVLVQFMDEFRKELDGIQMEVEDMPTEILNKKYTADPNMSAKELRDATMYDSDEDHPGRENNPGLRVNRRHVMFSKAMAAPSN